MRSFFKNQGPKARAALVVLALAAAALAAFAERGAHQWPPIGS